MTNKDFIERVHAVVRGIPRGTAMAYKEVAVMAGYPRAWRAVGALMSKNYDETIPCHRVIRSDGTAGEYNKGSAKKVHILAEEGVIIKK